MNTTTRIVLLVATLVIIAVGVSAEFIPVQVEDINFRQHTVNAGELVRGALVGQTFVSPQDDLSGVAVLFATYSGRSNTRSVRFHLRTSPTATEDLRLVEVHPSELGDNQFHTFEFEPIPNSAEQSFFFFVTSPNSEPGNAITVDLNTQDPYHLGTAFLVKNGDTEVPTPEMIAASGKQTVDVVFGTAHTVSLRQATVAFARSTYTSVRGSWAERKGDYWLWVLLTLPLLGLIALLVQSRGDGETRVALKKRTVQALLVGLIIAGIGLRLLYARSLPITNDEGNYLYDAQSVLRGVLAGGDGYVKAPLVVLWVSLWQLILGNTLLAGRLASIVASTLIALPLYFIGREAYGQRTGLLAAAVWALLGAPVVFGIYIHTQSVALLFGVSGIAVLWLALREKVGRKQQPDGLMSHTPISWFIYAGVLFGLGVASRKSILALGLVPLALIFVETISLKLKLRRLFQVGLGFLIVIALFLSSAYFLYGTEGIWEALGANSAEDGITAVDPAEAEQVRAYSIRGVTPFFREALPLLFFGLLGWGLLLETTLRRYIKGRVKRPPSKIMQLALEYLIPKLLWVLPAATLWWAWQFFFEYEGAIYHDFGGITFAWYAFVGLLLLIVFWQRPEEDRFVFDYSDEDQAPARSTQPLANTIGKVRSYNTVGAKERATAEAAVEERTSRQLLAAAILLPAWVIGLVVFYVNWIKFHANYIVEFLPPLAVATGIGLYFVWRRLTGSKSFAERHPILHLGHWAASILFVIFIIWTGYVTNYITYTVPHTGTFDQGSVREAAVWARENIPLEEPIFTGAAVVPYLSGHRTALDIAHPRWYAYEFTRKDETRLNTFLPSAEEMLEAYREAEWFLREKQTGFSFLMEYTEIEAGLETDWEEVHSIENGSNTLVFYRRIQP